MSQLAITTSPELIKLLGQKLYDHRLDFILARELLQNAVDAGTKDSPVDISVAWHDHDFEIVVDDQGCGMTEKVLTEVFLNIGGSYKPNQEGESTGGFGVAKVALFNADRWQVHTKDCFIDQSLEFESVDSREGTRVSAKVKFEEITYAYQLQKTMRLLYSNAHSNLWVNGSEVEPYRPRTRLHRHETGDGVEFTVRFADGFSYEYGDTTYTAQGYVIYRINGLTQYLTYGGGDLERAGKNILVDFGRIGYRPTDKGYPFTMSRESVTNDVQIAVNTLLQKLAKDTRSTIREAGRNPSKHREWANPNTGLISFSEDGKVFRPNLTQRRVARLWQEVVETMQPSTEFRFGVTNDFEVNAFIQGAMSDTPIMVINPDNFTRHLSTAINNADSGAVVMAMWHLACHELAHQKYTGHDEDFTSEEAAIANATVMRVVNNLNDLRVLARRIWGK